MQFFNGEKEKMSSMVSVESSTIISLLFQGGTQKSFLTTRTYTYWQTGALKHRSEQFSLERTRTMDEVKKVSLPFKKNPRRQTRIR
jgi:hypothetical protein